MKTAARFWIAVGTLASLGLGFEARAAKVDVDDCEARASWDGGDILDEAWAARYRDAVTGKMPAIQSFAEAMNLRMQAKSPEAKIFGEYWASWSLTKMGLHHSAYQGFAVVAAKEVLPKVAVAQTAALNCLAWIHTRYPTLPFNDKLSDRLKDYPVSEARSKGAIIHLQDLAADSKSFGDMDKFVKLTQDGSPFRYFARLIHATAQRKYDDALDASKNLTARPLPVSLKSYDDTIRLLTGRAYYSKGDFNEAALQFQAISKSSNHLARALSDLAWGFLKAEKYREALGTVINLHSGGFRRTFTPEAPMVMAMSFNEICHYPESIKAIEAFRVGYRDSFVWLKQWSDQPGSHDLYREAVDFVRNPKESEIPARVASEWVRSPTFIGRQDEINLLKSAPKKAVSLSEEAKILQNKLAEELLASIRGVKPRYDQAKAKDPTGDLPIRIRQEIDQLKTMVTHYKRMKRAAPAWRLVLDSQEKRAVGTEKKLVAGIKGDLQLINKRMYAQLEDVADNIYFVEFEIYQGATQDIIWQNAHPEFKKLAEKLSKAQNDQDASKTWNWGNIKGGLAGTHEIWEDELGAFRADLPDNCESKEKFLNIQRQLSSVGP